MKVEIKFLNKSQKHVSLLGREGKRRLEEILKTLSFNPSKTNWPAIYKYETLKYQTYKGLPIHSLRLSNRDRFCYSVDSQHKLVYLRFIN